MSGLGSLVEGTCEATTGSAAALREEVGKDVNGWRERERERERKGEGERGRERTRKWTHMCYADRGKRGQGRVDTPSSLL